MVRSGFIFLGFLLFILIIIRVENPPKVDGHEGNHITCTVESAQGPDRLKGKTATHLARFAVPTGARDNYPYNGNGPDPYTSRHPTEGFVVDYMVISQPPASTYTSTQNFNDSPQVSCSYTISCKNSCDPAIASGSCSDSCNVTLASGACPRYGTSYSYTVKTGGSATTITWGDGSSSWG